MPAEVLSWECAILIWVQEVAWAQVRRTFDTIRKIINWPYKLVIQPNNARLQFCFSARVLERTGQHYQGYYIIPRYDETIEVLYDYCSFLLFDCHLNYIALNILGQRYSVKLCIKWVYLQSLAKGKHPTMHIREIIKL